MSDSSAPPVTFVTPRYGAEVFAGAEAGARSLATRLAAEGRRVDVITSRAVSLHTWEDHYPAGTAIEDGVRVTRCSVDRHRAPDFDARCADLLPRAATASPAECEAWIDAQGPTSTELVEAVAGVDDGVIVFYPYLYHPTVAGRRVARVPTVLYPAAHAEAPLGLPVFDEVFGGVDGLAFHTVAEQRLVAQRFPATSTSPQGVVGLPIEASESGDPVAARERFGLGDGPLVLCLGRIDRGKGVHDLASWFQQRVGGERSARLVLAGTVSEPPPAGHGVVCVGPVTEMEKADLLAAADVLVNPSPMESFSIVLLEAWLADTPVLVNGWCAPTVEHVAACGGGLWYTGPAELDIALDRLLGDASARRAMGEAGRRYVEDRYSWPAVRRRFDAVLGRVVGPVSRSLR